jgi:hypothetical protein
MPIISGAVSVNFAGTLVNISIIIFRTENNDGVVSIFKKTL